MLTLRQPANGMLSHALDVRPAAGREDGGDRPGVVVCLHGFPDHPPSLEGLLEAIARAGHRSIAPWLRGYEPTSQPRDGRFDIAAHRDDVIAWLDVLELDSVHVVGHDWGAVIGYYLAQTASERVRSLTAIAVPWLGEVFSGLLRVPSQLRKSWYMAFFQWPGAARVVRWRRLQLLERLWRDWSPGWFPEQRVWDGVCRTFAQTGVVEGALATYRAAFAPTSRHTRRWLARRAAPVEAPTLAITGARDGCIDTRLFDGWPEAAFPAGLQVKRIEGAGHFVHLEAAERVESLLLQHLRSNDQTAEM